MWFVFPLEDLVDDYNTYLASLIELGYDHEIVLGSLMSVMHSFSGLTGVDRSRADIFNSYMSGAVYNELCDVLHGEDSRQVEVIAGVVIQLLSILVDKRYDLCMCLYDMMANSGGSIYYQSTSGPNLIFWIEPLK